MCPALAVCRRNSFPSHPATHLNTMSSIDPRNTIDNSGTDPNKGLRTRPFLIAVIVAVVVLLLVIIVFVHRSSTAITPQRDTKPKSSLAAPIPSAGILRHSA